MEYYAHTSEDGMRRQTVAAHCRKAASYAAECLSSVGLSNTAYLAGLMHDTGKLTQEYQPIWNAPHAVKQCGAVPWFIPLQEFDFY